MYNRRDLRVAVAGEVHEREVPAQVEGEEVPNVFTCIYIHVYIYIYIYI